MSETSPERQPADPNSIRSRMRLECIGSFNAYTAEGKVHTIEIWTHFASVHDRNRARVTPSQLVLTTTEGFGVDRIGQGEYCLTDDPLTTFSTDDPSAP